MANWNKLTESKYNAIKLLLKGGASQAEASEYLQIAIGTVNRVKNTETFEEYNQQTAMITQAIAAKKAHKNNNETPQETPPANPTVVRIEATHYMMQELQKTNELLTQISRKLAFVVDELCGTKEG